MSQTIITTCPYCHKPHKVNVSAFENVASAPPAVIEAARSNLLTSFLASDVGLALGLGGLTWIYAAAYNHSPAWAVGIGFLAGFGFPVLRLWLSRPYLVQPKPDKVQVDVLIDDRSGGGFTRSLDGFNSDLVGWDDLVKLAAAPAFSRDGATKAGLSQSKWHKCKSEFLRLNYCVSMPNNANGYALTIRGRHLLEKIRASTNNNKQRRFYRPAWAN